MRRLFDDKQGLRIKRDEILDDHFLAILFVLEFLAFPFPALALGALALGALALGALALGALALGALALGALALGALAFGLAGDEALAGEAPLAGEAALGALALGALALGALAFGVLLTALGLLLDALRDYINKEFTVDLPDAFAIFLLIINIWSTNFIYNQLFFNTKSDWLN